MTSTVIRGNNFSSNKATASGTVFWMSYSGMPFPIEQDNYFYRNLAVYGANIATEAFQLAATPSTIEVVDYVSGVFPPAISISIQDRYGQFVSTENGSTISAAITRSTKQLYSCQMNNPKLFGLSSAIVRSGEAIFDLLGVQCIPGGFTFVTFVCPVGVSILQFPTYNYDSMSKLRSLSSMQLMSLKVKTNFRHCKVGEKFDYFSATKSTCSVCTDGYSVHDNYDNNVIKCLPCPKGASFCYGSQIYLPVGSWRLSDKSSSIFSCPMIGSCRGGNVSGNSSCIFPTWGPLCGICGDGYYYQSSLQSCQSCSGFSKVSFEQILKWIILGVMILYGFVYVLKTYCSNMWTDFTNRIQGNNRSDASIEDVDNVEIESQNDMNSSKWSSRMKIILTTFQILFQSSPSSSSFQYPKGFSTVASFFSFVNFDISGIIPLQCFFQYDYLTYMSMLTGAPLFLVLSGYSLLLSFSIVAQTILSIYFSRQVAVGILRRLKVFLLSNVVTFAYFALPVISSTIFAVFGCINVDPFHEVSTSNRLFLLSDMSVSCETNIYFEYRNWAIVMILIYPVGITLLLLHMLQLHKVEIVERFHISRAANSKLIVPRRGYIKKRSPKVSDSLEMLYGSYHPQYWYWEIIEVFRHSC